MEIIIAKNKEYAFQSFFVGLKRQAQSKRKLAQFDFLEIPDNILSKASSLIGVNKKDYNKTQKKNRLDIRKFFNGLWGKKESEIKKVLTLLKDIKKYSSWLIEQIPLHTGVSWPYEKLHIYPNVVSWASKTGHYISIGITPPHFLEKDLVSVITHELIHVNTDMLKFENLKYPRDSSEMANTLITGKITRAMNKKFGILIRNLRLAVPFRKYDEDWKHLKNLAKNANDFEIVAVKIDNFLISKNHKEVYKK